MSKRAQKNSFSTLTTLDCGAGKVFFHSLGRLEAAGAGDVSRLPYTIKVLLENALRTENGREITAAHIENLAGYEASITGAKEVPFLPARILVQDFTGVPAMVDLAALRSAAVRLGANPRSINPLVTVDLVIDHSVRVDCHGTRQAAQENARLEFERNRERYRFLHWAQKAFDNLRVFPPASGICHQINLEHLACVVQRQTQPEDGQDLVFCDNLVGLDSHTTMVNGLGVLGWGVGGIEAEAAMLGQPVYLLIPPVVGVELTGRLPERATATDLALHVTQLLRQKGVVGKFVEFYGPGLGSLRLADRASVANMAPEYGATCGFFPVDEETLAYLRQTGRTHEQVELVERFTKEQGLFASVGTPRPAYSELVQLDLSRIEPSLAGPRRPQDRIALHDMKGTWQNLLATPEEKGGYGLDDKARGRQVTLGESHRPFTHGAVVIAAITSCTNTSNPGLMLAAGCLAKRAVEAGLSVDPAVKTSLAPGSRVVDDYLRASGLMPYLERLGFNIVGYGCTTCIGNSGPLSAPVESAIDNGALVATAVVSGNRNFPGRIHGKVLGTFLASPPLVVAYALAGTVDIDLGNEPLGNDQSGQPVFLEDIWPREEEIAGLMQHAYLPETYRRVYASLTDSNSDWNQLASPSGDMYSWDQTSTYIREPPFFSEMSREAPGVRPIEGARVLLLLPDSITTDHISPAGSIADDSPAGSYLSGKDVEPRDFNSYGSRRGNDRVMTRGTFANIRLVNRLANGRQGGYTTHLPGGEIVTVFEAARRYSQAGIPAIVIAGADYGMGSSRDWAAKGTLLLGVRAVVARSFERIHRSNLIGMGVLPLEFIAGQDADKLGLTGREIFTIHVDDDLKPGQQVKVEAKDEGGVKRNFETTCRIDTWMELDYYKNGGILQAVLRRIVDGVD